MRTRRVYAQSEFKPIHLSFACLLSENSERVDGVPRILAVQSERAWRLTVVKKRNPFYDASNVTERMDGSPGGGWWDKALHHNNQQLRRVVDKALQPQHQLRRRSAHCSTELGSSMHNSNSRSPNRRNNQARPKISLFNFPFKPRRQQRTRLSSAPSGGMVVN